MKQVGLATLVVIIFLGCANAGTVAQQSRSGRQLEFSQIERIEFGRVSAAEARHSIGDPDQVVHLKDGADAWIYYEGQGDRQAQRLSLYIDSKSLKVLSATWIPREADSLHQQERALAHFNGAKFKISGSGRFTMDSPSSDLVYEDQKKGIALQLNPTTRSVQLISFSAPSIREPANKH